MALVDNAWYLNYGDGSTTGYYAVTAWATGTIVAAGALRRQLAAPAVGSERVFVCVVAGTTHATTEPTWVITRGGKTTDNTVTWQECTGIAALNGDATNTPSWSITATPPGGVKNTAVTLGQVIKRDNGASYQICTTAGTAGNGAEPAFSDTAGTTTADNTVTWTSLGVVGNFTGWQAPHARGANAFAANWGQAGNAFFVASEHAETRATSLTWAGPAITTNPFFVYCVNKNNVPPTSANLTTGASVTTTATSSITLTGYIYCYGVSFNCGTGVVNVGFFIGTASATVARLDTCALALVASGSASTYQFGCTGGNSQSKITFVNTTLSFGHSGQGVGLRQGKFLWLNTPSAIVGATIPTTLIVVGSAAQAGTFTLIGVDLSALGSVSTLVNAAGIGGVSKVELFYCKLGASVTITSTPQSQGSVEIDVVNCDSAGTNYQSYRYWYAGTQITETTIIRTGGATDGTTPISQNITTTANSKWIFPFESQPITIWNNSTSAITTLTIYGTTTGGGVPKDDEVWAEVEYLGSGSSPQGSFITSTKADNLAASAATNNSADGSTWGGGGAGNGFKIVVPSFTPGMKGPINITIKAAKISSTYYIDPRPSISGVTVSKSEILAPGVYANELSSGGSSGMLFIPNMDGT